MPLSNQRAIWLTTKAAAGQAPLTPEEQAELAQHDAEMAAKPNRGLVEGLGDMAKSIPGVGDDIKNAENALSGPSTANKGLDTQAIRGLRDSYTQELAGAGDRGVEGARTAYVGHENLGPAAQARAAQLARVGDVRAPNLGPAAQASAELADAHFAEAAQARAAQGDAALTQAATIERAGPTSAARLDPAAQAAQLRLDQSRADESRGVQKEALGHVRDVLAGKTPSVAEMQTTNAYNRLAADQSARAAGARGLSAGAARRQAAYNMAKLGGDSAAAGGLVRAQEQQTARGQLAGFATDIRGQDLGAATSEMAEGGATNRFNAGQTNETARLQGQLTQANEIANADRAQAANNLQGQLITNVNQGNAQRLTDTSMGNAQMATGVSATNAGLTTGVSQANAQRATDVSQGNAGRVTDTSQFNAGANNLRGFQAGQMQLDAATGNANRGMQQNLAQFGAEQDTGLFNTGQTNARAVDQGRMNVDVGTTNAGAFNDNERQLAALRMQGRGLDDDRRADLRGGALNAATQASASEQGKLQIGQQQTESRRQAATGLAKSTAKVFGIGL